MKIIITGATGMVGKGVLLECLDHPDVTEVLAINRRDTALKHHKLKTLIHSDFSDYTAIAHALQGYDAVFLCMGVSAAGLSEQQYTKLTYEYTLNLARTLVGLNAQMTLTYVSGEGTDSSENGRSMWARVKGKTENDLLNLGFKQAFMFRPGGIIPMKGVEPSSKMYRVLIKNLGWLLKIIKALAPNSIVDTTQIGLAMINITKKGYGKKVIRPRDIIELSKF